MSDRVPNMDRIAKVIQWMITIILVGFVLYYIAMKIYNHTALREWVKSWSGG